MKRGTVCLALSLLVSLCCNRVAAQAEVSGWGNLRGIRVGGQLVAFTTAVGVYNPDFSQLTLSQREGPIRTSQYVRSNNAVTVGETLQYGAGGPRGGAGQRGATNVAAGTNSSGATNLAGGFGRHLSVEAARRIGLIPNLPDAKFVQVGNAAIEGAAIALLNKSRRAQLEELVKTVEHCRLETHPRFFDFFVDGCQFKPMEAANPIVG